MSKSLQIINFFILTYILLLSACLSSDNSSFKVKSSALGVMNEIIIISDQDIWDGPVGDSIRYFFGGAYPITPQPEPIFDLRHFTISELENRPLRKELRTYMIVSDLADSSSETAIMTRNDLGNNGIQKTINDLTFNTSIGKNKWANGQILIYLFANGFDRLASAVGSNFPSISTRVRSHDDLQLTQSTYARGTNKGLSSKLSEIIGCSIELPIGYIVAKEMPDENMIWLRRDTKNATLNLVLHKENYTEKVQTTKANMKRLRNDFGKRFVSSAGANTYMLINDVDLPILEYTKDINGLYTKEFRGIWEMNNDFMGGPFITYLIVNGKDLIYVDAFVWAPGKDKRDFMQQLEKIVSSLNKESD